MEAEMEVPQMGILLIALLYQKSPFLRTGFGNCLQKGCEWGREAGRKEKATSVQQIKILVQEKKQTAAISKMSRWRL